MGGCGEAHGKALLAGGEAEGESDMRLPDAAWAEQDYVLTARDVLAAREIQHQHLVEGTSKNSPFSGVVDLESG